MAFLQAAFFDEPTSLQKVIPNYAIQQLFFCENIYNPKLKPVDTA